MQTKRPHRNAKKKNRLKSIFRRCPVQFNNWTAQGKFKNKPLVSRNWSAQDRSNVTACHTTEEQNVLSNAAT